MIVISKAEPWYMSFFSLFIRFKIHNKDHPFNYLFLLPSSQYGIMSMNSLNMAWIFFFAASPNFSFAISPFHVRLQPSLLRSLRHQISSSPLFFSPLGFGVVALLLKSLLLTCSLLHMFYFSKISIGRVVYHQFRVHNSATTRNVGAASDSAALMSVSFLSLRNIVRSLLFPLFELNICVCNIFYAAPLQGSNLNFAIAVLQM